MICQKVKNFNIGSLNKTKVTASSGLILIMSFAKEIGLAAVLEKRLSHLKKRKRGYCVSEKILSFVEMLIKGGRRLNDIDILSSDPGLLDILEMDKFPQANTLGDLARRFTRRDINNLADIVMKLSSNTIAHKGLKEIVIDIDSTLIPSEVEIAKMSYEGFRGFNPLMGIIKGKGLSMAGFSLFRSGNASPAGNNLSLLRKVSKYLEKNNPGVKLIVRIHSTGYNHRIMRYCDKKGHGFVIAGDKYEIVLDTIAAIEEDKWKKLKKRKKRSYANKKRWLRVSILWALRKGARLIVLSLSGARIINWPYFQSTNTPTGFILPIRIGINIKSFTSTGKEEMPKMSLKNKKKALLWKTYYRKIFWSMSIFSRCSYLPITLFNISNTPTSREVSGT